MKSETQTSLDIERLQGLVFLHLLKTRADAYNSEMELRRASIIRKLLKQNKWYKWDFL